MHPLLETLTLDDHEDVVEIFRTDNGPMIRLLLIDVLIVLVLFFFITPLFRAGPWGVGVFLLGLLLCGLLGWRAVIKWMGSICVASTARVIVIERTGFWAKKFREIAYKEIVHTQYTKKGPVNTWRDIGSVQCMVKSTTSLFYIDHVVHPQRLLEIIGTYTTFSSSPQMPISSVSHEPVRPLFSHQNIPIPAEIKKKVPPSVDEYWDRMQS